VVKIDTTSRDDVRLDRSGGGSHCWESDGTNMVCGSRADSGAPHRAQKAAPPSVAIAPQAGFGHALAITGYLLGTGHSQRTRPPP